MRRIEWPAEQTLLYWLLPGSSLSTAHEARALLALNTLRSDNAQASKFNMRSQILGLRTQGCIVGILPSLCVGIQRYQERREGEAFRLMSLLLQNNLLQAASHDPNTQGIIHSP